MKILDGSELAAFIKERQAKNVRSLKQAHGVHPKLAIVKTIDDKVIDTYVRLKKRYGADIGVEVEVHSISQPEITELIQQINEDKSTHGIIVQLPLADPQQLDQVLNSIALSKDVDGLAVGTLFEPATPKAIEWLLDGYNIELEGKEIVIVGKGRLVGAPLEHMLKQRGLRVTSLDKTTRDLSDSLSNADVVISATGQPGLITANMVPQNAVVVDAGVATDGKRTIGDVAEDVYDRSDLTLTPRKGGVGPLTVCSLFENLLRAASG